ncbi:MAG: FAD-dependent oxidoreductase [Chloroflexota bacterium]|nr:FAD-dependent oxidoreductase [Chloroflexota bacterium]
MSSQTADVVICGAGIAGISTAYHLSVHAGVRQVLLVDERPPLSLTSDKSTECYRNWWPGPGPAMVQMMNRSIDILEDLAEESGNRFNLNRRGYLFATADPARIEDYKAHACEAESLGAGALRIHDGQTAGPAYQALQMEGYQGQPDGADLITDQALIRENFPYLSEDTVAVIHPRRAGWFSAQQLGMYMLEQARQHGTQLVEGHVDRVDQRGGRVQAVQVRTKQGVLRIDTPNFVNAAGPFIKPVGVLLNEHLPVFSELHIKVSINDHLGVFPRNAPLLIWSDELQLPWRDDERAVLAEDDETRYLLETFPEGVHARPEGPQDSPIVLILWTYDVDPVQPTFPITYDSNYPEIALRGLARMLPALETYFDRPPKPWLDGGYYTKTEENRPLVGPLSLDGAWIIGALSGFGLMASPACGELLSKHITGSDLPPYTPWFRLARYEDPEYQDLLKSWEQTGQL